MNYHGDFRKGFIEREYLEKLSLPGRIYISVLWKRGNYSTVLRKGGNYTTVAL